MRAAQASLLAPPPDAVGAAAGAPLKFSRNVVVLEVRGAPVNLTLIDLPGIIQNVERPQDGPYRDLVGALLREYVARDNAIIVATVSCKEDIETQVGVPGCGWVGGCLRRCAGRVWLGGCGRGGVWVAGGVLACAACAGGSRASA